MLASNPIWFREQQAWKARRARLPWWRRHLRFTTLPLIWCGTTGLCLLLAILTTNMWDEHPFRQAVGTSILFAFYLQFAYLVFRSLIAGASALVRERELQTMDTLLSSPLPTRELLFGKWLTTAVPLLIETTLVLPLGLILRTYSGSYHTSDSVAFWQIGDAYLLSVSVLVALTAAGLVMSTRSRNSGQAATHAVLAGLGLVLGSYLVDVLVQVFRNKSTLTPILCWLNPYTAWWSIWVGDSCDWTTHVHNNLWEVSAVGYLLLAALAGRVAWQRLRRASQA